MGGEKVTYMVIKADLQCPCCYKKIKKLLCKFPQIRDQVYDEKKNLVTITVVCCNPEKIRHKLCCKGGKLIQSIDILEPPKPKPPPEKPADKPKPPPEKPADKLKPPPEKPKDPIKKPDPAPPPVLPPPPPPTPGPGPDGSCRVPVGYFGTQCYGGCCQCPCCSGYGRPAPPPPCYNSNYGGGYAYFGKPCYASRCCDDYFSEENTSSCSIM